MKKIILLAVVLFSCSVQAEQDSLFAQKVDRMLNAPVLKNATVGIEMWEAERREVIYAHNSNKLFSPASNMKIVVSLGALVFLKPEYRFETDVFVDSGNLYIKGCGDPSLCTDDLEKISEKLIERGVTRIEDMIYDDGYFDEKEFGRGWIEEDEAYGFNARISALSLNRNCVRISVKPGKETGDKVRFALYPRTDFVQVRNLASTGQIDSLIVQRKSVNDRNVIVLRGVMKKGAKGRTFTRHIDNPSLYVATVFKEMLEEHGMQIAGKLRRGESPVSCVPVYRHISKPLVQLIYDMNKWSLNFYADQILKAIGARVLGAPGSFEKGSLEIKRLLTVLGLTEEEFRMYDGSGLSRYNLISPHGIVKVLAGALAQTDIRPEFLSSLPVAGVDGTLESRMGGSHSLRRVRAKTGTMRGVSSLSGYVLMNDNREVIFSIIMNNYTCPARLIREIQDNIVRLITSEL
jgi:D-alanyl-D-alanine carboxypeptidase/D-alanyl-D-alanine-endopeptidase (penicillin-binding protein 4)